MVIFFKFFPTKSSPYMMPFSEELYDGIDRHDRLHLFGSRRAERTELTKKGSRKKGSRAVLSDHVTVVGIPAVRQGLAGCLCGAYEAVRAVTCALGTLEALTCRTMRGGAHHFAATRTTGRSNAQAVISALHPTGASNFLAYRAGEAGVLAAIHGLNNHTVRTSGSLDASDIISAEHAGRRHTRGIVPAHDRANARFEA